MRLILYNPSINAKGLSLKKEWARFLYPRLVQVFPSLCIFLYKGRLGRHLLRSRPPSLYLVSRVWKTLNGFLMTLKGRGMRAARRARKVSRAEARERRSNSWYPRYTSLPTTDDGRDYWVVTGRDFIQVSRARDTKNDASLRCRTRVTVNPSIENLWWHEGWVLGIRETSPLGDKFFSLPHVSDQLVTHKFVFPTVSWLNPKAKSIKLLLKFIYEKLWFRNMCFALLKIEIDNNNVYDMSYIMKFNRLKK